MYLFSFSVFGEGSLPQERFSAFDDNLTRIVNELAMLLGAPEDVRMQEPTPEYSVVCNILPDIRELEREMRETERM